MSSSRREFLQTAGAAAALLALKGHEVSWTPEAAADPGWTPGLETRPASTCLICPARCGIRGRVVDGNLVRIVGNPLHPMSRGGLCPRGVAGVQMLYHPERRAAPLVRVGPRGSGQWQPVSRAAAIDRISERVRALRAAGRPEALAVLDGHASGSMQDLWRQFLRACGSPNYIADEYEDGTAAVMALMHGMPRRPGYDLERAEFVMSFGVPLFEAWWSPLQAFVAFAPPNEERRSRRRFVQIDTRFSRTAAYADEWVGVHPGTYAALALGIAYVLVRDELYDASFVQEHVTGFEDFLDAQGVRREGYRSVVMRHFRTEEVSAITGVPVERITGLARALATNGPAIVVCGSDVLLAPNGLLAGLAVHSLNALLGSVGRPGGVLFGSDPPVGPLAPLVQDAISRAGLEHAPVLGTAPAVGDGDRAMRFAEALTQAPEATVDTLLLYYADPLASSARPEFWQAALARVPFVVSFSPFLDETTSYADLILPDLLPYERWEDAPAPRSYPYPVWGVVRPLVEPHPDGTHAGDVVLAIAGRLGGTVQRSLPYDSVASLLKARARGLFAARRGMILGAEFEREHHRQMEARGWWLPEHTDFEPFWNQLLERGGWLDLFYDHSDPARLAQTPSGHIELLPSALLQLLERAGSERRPYVGVGPTEAPGTAYPLRLLPYRASTLASGSLRLQRWVAEQPTAFPEVLWVPWVEVAPKTARALGLPDDTDVWVVSPRGRYRARLKAFAGTAPGTVGAPYGIRRPGGPPANPLRLLDGPPDPLTGLPSWSSTFVRLERA